MCSQYETRTHTRSTRIERTWPDLASVSRATFSTVMTAVEYYRKLTKPLTFFFCVPYSLALQTFSRHHLLITFYESVLKNKIIFNLVISKLWSIGYRRWWWRQRLSLQIIKISNMTYWLWHWCRPFRSFLTISLKWSAHSSQLKPWHFILKKKSKACAGETYRDHCTKRRRHASSRRNQATHFPLTKTRYSNCGVS